VERKSKLQSLHKRKHINISPLEHETGEGRQPEERRNSNRKEKRGGRNKGSAAPLLHVYLGTAEKKGREKKGLREEEKEKEVFIGE